ncbi:hypothetical protein ACSXC4_17270 (plasmid) [Clostridium perfringens]|uniref:hypothetical protein n=1 Tax=Clostridium perfringens TaxID=1502 RepID=UPI0024BCFA65|nr:MULTISPECIES: hypothetical protein [Clostridium]MDK7591426.1 hypothetical protein [Clostridium sp. UMB9555B]MDK7629745.1 hypothetical protein [Clostridium sp. UMB9555A]
MVLTFSTGFKVFANENNSASSETLENIEILEDNETIFKTKAIFSSGRVEIVTINKINDKVLVEENNEKLAEYNANEIIKVTNEDNKIRAKRDAGSWYQVSSWPRTNVEADYKRVSAVVSLAMIKMKVPYSVAYNAIKYMYQMATGKDLPTVFGYLAKKWEYSGFVYKDKHNSSNGKVVYHYWFDGVWKNYHAAYFTWS